MAPGLAHHTIFVSLVMYKYFNSLVLKDRLDIHMNGESTTMTRRLSIPSRDPVPKFGGAN